MVAETGFAWIECPARGSSPSEITTHYRYAADEASTYRLCFELLGQSLPRKLAPECKLERKRCPYRATVAE